MSKVIQLEFELNNIEYAALMEHEKVRGRLSNFVFVEICEKFGMGFITKFNIEEKEDEQE